MFQFKMYANMVCTLVDDEPYTLTPFKKIKCMELNYK
jgi:hypothetical protein